MTLFGCPGMGLDPWDDPFWDTVFDENRYDLIREYRGFCYLGMSKNDPFWGWVHG